MTSDNESCARPECLDMIFQLTPSLQHEALADSGWVRMNPPLGCKNTTLQLLADRRSSIQQSEQF